MTEPFASPDDFPQVWQKPSFEELLACLKQLHVDPPVWNSKASKQSVRGKSESARYRRGVVSYLCSIVSNGLRWINDDDQKEILWEEASRCLAQRCGRAGMGEITRRWPLETRQVPFELIVREPPITGDSLGHKTWCSSYLLAQLLDSIAAESLAHLLGPGHRQPLSILELGSGTGLLGIAAAAMWQAEVVLSDLPEIMPNLDHNIEQNRATVEQLGGKLSSGTLVWGSEDGNHPRFSLKNQFNIVLVADSIYDDCHPDLLASTIQEQSCRNLDSRVIVMSPIRDQTTKKLVAQFRSKMGNGALPFVILEEHTLIGEDDWGNDEEFQTVECWWAIFGRQAP
ncbi:putative methyltransferase-domain-containing protein [Xylaria sp. CBS 124048]|nr:putative methyltransferase-domain-containing protein [Xylaria sp. CBS 124048]